MQYIPEKHSDNLIQFSILFCAQRSAYILSTIFSILSSIIFQGRAPLFIGGARPISLREIRHSSRNNVRCPPSHLLPYLLMNLLARSRIICVLCLGFDYLSFSLSISSFNSINRVVMADAASARIYLPPDWTPSFFLFIR